MFDFWERKSGRTHNEKSENFVGLSYGPNIPLTFWNQVLIFGAIASIPKLKINTGQTGQSGIVPE